MTMLTHTATWGALAAHRDEIADTHLRALFAADPDRFERFSVRGAGLFLDYSKNRIDARGLALLMALARERGLEGARAAMFGGRRINTTEDRAVLHVALRNRGDDPIEVDGKDVMPAVREVLQRIGAFAEAVRDGSWRGHSGEVRIGPGDIALTVLVLSPSDDRAVRLQAQTMLHSRGHGDEARVRHGHVGLTKVIFSPSHDRTVGLQAQAVNPACGHANELRVRRGDVRLTAFV